MRRLFFFSADFLTDEIAGPILLAILVLPVFMPPFGGAYFDVYKYALLLVITAWGLWRARQRTDLVKFGWSRYTRLFAFWLLGALCLVTLSSVLSRNPVLAVFGNYPRFHTSWLLFVCSGILARLTLRLTTASRLMLLKTLVISSAVVASFGILQSLGIGYYGGLESFFRSLPERVPSTLGNPNFSSWWVAVAVPVVWALWAETKLAKMRVAWLLCAVVFYASLACFASRGAILAAGVGVMCWVLSQFIIGDKRKAGLAAILSCIWLGLLAPVYGLYRPSSTAMPAAAAMDKQSVSQRYEAWDIFGQIAETHPWFGTGPGSFRDYFAEFAPGPMVAGEVPFDDPHNLPIAIWVMFGWLGLVWLGLLLALVIVAMTTWWRCKQLTWQQQACFAALTAWFVASWFNPAVAAVWALVAVLLGILFASTDDVVQPPAVAAFQLRQVLIGGFAVILMWIGGGMLAGEYFIVKAIQAVSPGAADAGQLGRAYQAAGMAVRAWPLSHTARFIRADLAIRLGRPAVTVRRDIDFAFWLNRYSDTAPYFAAQVYAQMWQRDHTEFDKLQAISFTQSATMRGKFSPGLERWLSAFWWELGDEQLARQWLNYALARQPSQRDWVTLAFYSQQTGSSGTLVFALKQAGYRKPHDKSWAEIAKLAMADNGLGLPLPQMLDQRLARFR